MKIKGQNIRLAIEVPTGTDVGSKILYFAAATSATLNVSADLEDSSTKDDVVDKVAWRRQEVIGKNWDCSADVQIIDTDSIGEDGIGGFDLADLVGQEVYVEVNIVSGAKNRTADTKLYNGYAIISAWNANLANRQTATASVTLQGQGELKKVSA